jgi:hypothetical protein
MPRTVPSQVVELIQQKLPQASANVDVTGQTAPFLMAVARLVDEIPVELLTISGRDYDDLICGIEAIKVGVGRWLRSGHVGQISMPNLDGKNAVHLVRDALSKCPDQIPSMETAVLSFIDDPDLRESIRLDISSATNDLHDGQWKPATVVAGSAAEALLLWAIQRHPLQDTAPGRPNKAIEKWDLHEYAIVARALGLISDATLKQTMLAKDFRNLIHPGRAQRLGQVCDRGTALSALAAVEHIARDLSARTPP